MSKFIRTILLLLLTFVIACNSTKGLSSEASQQQPRALNANQTNGQIKLSAFAKSFLRDFKKEISKQKKDISDFKPTENLINHYGLLYFKDTYFVTGFITIEKGFNKDTLEQLNINTGRLLGNRMAVQIPLKSFFDFLKLNAIEYFEMNPKANPNN